MNKKTLWGKLACALVALTLVWGGVTGCNPQPPAPNTFTITFDSNGGSDVKAITKEEGAVVEAPIAPTKTGYNFVEWQKEDGTAYDWTAPLTASVKLKAKWDVVTYSITYLPKGVESKNPTTYTIETETITLEDPTNVPDATKPNFAGWYEDEACTKAVTGIEKGSYGEKTFYAKFTNKTVFTVKFVLDGKDFGKEQKVEEGETVTAIAGYDMYSDKELTKAFDIKTEIKAATTIYLKVKSFTVKFDSDGGSAVTAATVKYNETVKEPTAPTKDGFDFAGWYDGDTKFDFTTKITKDLTLKAKWTAKSAGTKQEVSVSEDGKVVTVLNPTMILKYGCTVDGNVINYSGNSAAAWTYENITDYSQVEIFYETTKENNRKISIKAFDENEGNQDVDYPELQSSGSIKFNISKFVDKLASFTHIGIANNANDNDWDNGPKWDADWTLKITKIVLTKVDQLEDKVIFDPATFTAPDGMEIVEKEGNKYLKVTPNGYGTDIPLPAGIDVSRYTSAEFTLYNEETGDWQNVISLKDYRDETTKENQNICGQYGASSVANKKGVVTYSATLTGSKFITSIQPIIQLIPDYSETTNKTMYIGKIVVKTK